MSERFNTRAGRWARRLGAALLFALAAAAVALAVYAQRALPRSDGAIELPGPKAELRIERDAHGVPTIRAATLDDALFGLGFVHAQDRLWQLETHRRIGAGRLAEAFGPAALDNDRFLRALGVRRAAAAQWSRLDADTRRALEAYAAGINAFLERELRARPPEFVILGLQPERWDPVDSLAWAVMMAWDLGGNWGSEMLRLQMASRLPMARINELLPPYPGERPLVTADYAALLREWQVALSDAGTQQRLAALERAAPPSGVEGAGSNNWVVAGSRSATGAPLLANDPHLKLSAPALWYYARIDTPALKVAGATLPGLPAVVLGQNEHIAWGYTNTNPDVQDLYLERVDPADPTRYRTPDGWARFESFDETIRVKGQPDVRMTVRRTRHGPVISDAGVGRGVLGPGAPLIAMRWTALDAEAWPTLAAALAMQRARSVDEFVAASADHVAPMQNMVVADRAGRIGFVAAGRVPLRRADNELKGQLPAPGWDARYDWAGFVDAAATPRETDPARGWIATANQRIHGTDYPHYMTSEWAPPYRQQRIELLLAERRTLSLDDFAAMQADVVSLATQRLLPHLRRAASTHRLAVAAQQRLASFDGTMAADDAAPLVFYAWVRQLAQGVFADEMGAAAYERSLGSRSHREALEGVLERDDAWWCDDKATADRRETCAEQSGAALTRALDELAARHGDDIARWRWGDAHVARSEHRPFSRVGLLARAFELRTPVGGDTYTVNVSRVSLRPEARTGELYLDEHGPSLRALYDVADPANSRYMHSTGQSGLVHSPLYRSFVERWAKVEYLPLWSGAAVDTLVVTPASRQASP